VSRCRADEVAEGNTPHVRFGSAAWLKLSLRAGDTSCFAKLTEFVTSVGRMKCARGTHASHRRLVTSQLSRSRYVRPLYRALYSHPAGKELAIATFQKHRSSYHAIAAKMVGRQRPQLGLLCAHPCVQVAKDLGLA
jgi:hypothetical protein